MPADSLLDAAHVEKVTAFAKEQKLAPEVAQTLLQRENDAVKGYAMAQKAIVETEKAGWMKTVEGDAELGGQYLARTVETTKRVVERYASDEFKKIMDNTGFGNHPEFVRFVARLGKAMTEDQLVIAPITPAPTVKKDASAVLYDHPSSKK